VTACPFCEIVTGRAPATKVREWGDVLAIEPLRPVTPGHVLVIPTRHVPDAGFAPWVTGRVFECAAEMIDEVGPANLITSAGEAATQTVMHLHVHLVPRRDGDGLKLPWTPSA
jgi:histidine triad (HIT) family protein